MYIVDDLKTKILIDINIIISKKTDIIVFISSTFIENCQIKISLKIRIKNEERVITQSIYIKKSVIIPSRFEIHIFVHYIILSNRIFFFEPDQNQLFLYIYLVNVFIITIIIKNNFDQIVKISRNLRLKTIQKADFDNCYHIIFEKIDIIELIIRRPKQKHY